MTFKPNKPSTPFPSFPLSVPFLSFLPLLLPFLILPIFPCLMLPPLQLLGMNLIQLLTPLIVQHKHPHTQQKRIRQQIIHKPELKQLIRKVNPLRVQLNFLKIEQELP